MNVLVVEREEGLAGPLVLAGHDVTVARSEHEAQELTATCSFDAIVLGALGREDQGLALCGALREGTTLPILLLLARNRVDLRVEGLENGADDCLGIDCPVDELLARLRALVRRSARVGTD